MERNGISPKCWEAVVTVCCINLEMRTLLLLLLTWRVNMEETKNNEPCNAVTLLDKFESEFSAMTHEQQTREWNFLTNMTSSTAEAREIFQPVYNQWMSTWKRWARNYRDSESCPMSTLVLIQSMSNGIVLDNPLIARRVSELRTSLSSFSTDKSGDDIVRAISTGRDPELLKSLWLKWAKRQRNSQPYFVALVDLLNDAARTNGYKDLTDNWNEGMETEGESLELWEKVKPLYEQLHAYVRGALVRAYGNQTVSPWSPLPVHLLGNVFGETWANIADVVMPGCGTACSSQHRMSPVEVVKRAELYFRSLGFPSLMRDFWERSIFSRPFNRTNIDCHASAYDFADGRDYRIKVCLDGSPTDLETVLHELGHVHYFMEYRHRPPLLRTAPLGAIHEAVGDAFSHGKSCEGPSRGADPTATSVHDLLREALQKIVSLPWILALDSWRYRVLRGQISSLELASSLWELRQKFQGIAPPNSEAREYFDVGGKYHVANFLPYMRYFFARLLEYQFLHSMCSIGDPEAPLHMCCFLKKEGSGRSIRHMMSYGATIPWRTALMAATGRKTIAAEPLLEYYQPLFVWLKRQNDHLKNPVGW